MISLIVDPPWEYTNRRTGGNMTSGSSAQYDVMSLKQVKALPVADIAGDMPSVCFLWGTVPLMEEAHVVLRTWGYRYKTTLFWIKTGPKLGMGFYMRGHVEFLLLGVRGDIRPPRTNYRNYIEHPVLTHSRKPKVFHHRVEKLFPDATRRVELFAQYRYRRWDTYGLALGHNFLNPSDWKCVVTGEGNIS